MQEVISKYSRLKFQWGLHDCCLFAADVAFAKSGKDPAEKHRGKYKTERGAFRSLKNNGSMVASMDAHFKRLDNINLAQRGDVVTFADHPGGGVVWSGGILSMNPEHGLVKVTHKIQYVWRVDA